MARPSPGLQTRADKTRPGVPPPLGSGTGTRREPAHIHRVRAGNWSRGVTTPVPLVHLPVLLTAPALSGSTGTTQLVEAAPTLSADPPSGLPPASPHRYDGKIGMHLPFGQTAPRGALSGQLYEYRRLEIPVTNGSAFLFPFGCQAFASWVSCSCHGIPPPLRLAYHHAYAGVMDLTGFPRSARIECDRVGCHLHPGSSGVHTTIGQSSVAACRFSTARSLSSPPARPDAESCRNEASAVVHWYSPFRSSPHL